MCLLSQESLLDSTRLHSVQGTHLSTELCARLPPTRPLAGKSGYVHPRHIHMLTQVCTPTNNPHMNIHSQMNIPHPYVHSWKHVHLLTHLRMYTLTDMEIPISRVHSHKCSHLHKHMHAHMNVHLHSWTYLHPCNECVLTYVGTHRHAHSCRHMCSTHSHEWTEK